MKPEQDAFGQMLLDYLNGIPSVELVERDDGFISQSLGGEQYFAPHDKWPPSEQMAMDYARGFVLDIGSGAGRHALHLQHNGHRVLATDNSPLAIKVCKERGIRETMVVPVTQITRKMGPFDTIMMMGNNFGLVSNIKRARWLLKRFHQFTTPPARLIVQSRNPYTTDDPQHLAYHKRNLERDRMAGQLRIRVRYRGYVGKWFDYLIVSVEEMQEIIEGTGWRISHILKDDESIYIAVLEKI